MGPSRDLILRTAELARAAPAAWAQFTSEFRKHTEKRRADCVQAPHDQVFRIQGHAQMCDALCELFENAIQAADKVQSRRPQP